MYSLFTLANTSVKHYLSSIASPVVTQFHLFFLIKNDFFNSRLGLKEHIRRAAYVAGWVGNQCKSDITLPNPEEYGWTIINGKFSPIWQQLIANIDTIDADILTLTCSCTTEKYNKLKCATKKLECITFCKCHRRCLYKLI